MKTKRSLIIALSLLLIVPAASAKEWEESLNYKLDGRTWEPARTIAPTENNRAMTKTFVPAGDDKDNWQELFIYHFQERPLTFSPQHYYEVYSGYYREAEEYKIKQISVSDDDVLFKWSVTGDQKTKTPDLIELQRMIFGKKGIHRIMYRKKTAEWPEEQEKFWIDLFNQAKVEFSNIGT